MRRLPPGHVCILGSVSWQRIDISASMVSGIATLDEGKSIASDPGMVWEAERTDSSEGGKKGDQVIIRGLNKQSGKKIQLVIKHRLPVVEALREIEMHEQGLGNSIPAAVFAAVLAVGEASKQGSREVRKASALFARLADAGTDISNSHWSEKELAHEVGKFIDVFLDRGDFPRVNASATDAARFWVSLAKALWDPEVRRKIAPQVLDIRYYALLARLAAAWLELKPDFRIKVSGVSLRATGPAREIAWPQVLEWEGGGVRNNILRYLTGYRSEIPYLDLPVNLACRKPEKPKWSNLRPEQAARLSIALMEEAIEKAICNPCGSFRVDLPEGTPLREWGVTALRIWLIPEKGMWVALEKRDKPGFSFRWKTKRPHVSRWVLSLQTIPAVHATLAALWRDLRVGGENVMLSEEPLQKEEVGTTGRVGKISFHGRIKWGSDHDLDCIRREAHKVRGHVRRLTAGKRASWRAKKLARGKGMILAPGTTYVRPHPRGDPDKDAGAVPTRAQGLARLVLAELEGRKRQGKEGRT